MDNLLKTIYQLTGMNPSEPSEPSKPEPSEPKPSEMKTIQISRDNMEMDIEFEFDSTGDNVYFTWVSHYDVSELQQDQVTLVEPGVVRLPVTLMMEDVPQPHLFTSQNGAICASFGEIDYSTLLCNFVETCVTRTINYQGDTYMVIIEDSVYSFLIKTAIKTFKDHFDKQPKKLFIRIDSTGTNNRITNLVPTEQIEKFLPVFMSDSEISNIFSQD